MAPAFASASRSREAKLSKPPSKKKPEAAPDQDDLQTGSYTLPAVLGGMLAPIHVVASEDIDAYDMLMDQYTEAVQPRDFVEWMWVRDLTDQTWEEFRAKRARAVRLRLAQREAVELIMKAHYPRNTDKSAEMEFEIQKDVADILRGEEIPAAGFKLIRERFDIKGWDMFGAVYQACLSDMERFQRIADRANARRNMTLREIDRRRDAVARRARNVATKLINAVDADFE